MATDVVRNTGYIKPVNGDETNKVVDNLDYTGEAKKYEQDFVVVAQLDAARQKDPHGIYLDDVQRVAAEAQRASIEGREPADVPPPAAGDVVQTVVTAEKLTGQVVPEGVKFSMPIVLGDEPKDWTGEVVESDKSESNKSESDDENREPKFA